MKYNFWGKRITHYPNSTDMDIYYDVEFHKESRETWKLYLKYNHSVIVEVLIPNKQ